VAAGRLGELLTALGLERLLEQEDEAPAELQRLAAEREEARASRDFARADEIRDRLAGEGWEIRDTPEGARLVRAPPRERGSRGGG
jgi:cysteinyl-tRNA synthetase